MSLVVTNNSNGTLTVTCGADSMTIGTPSPAQASPQAGGGPISWPTITPGGGGVATTLVETERLSTIKNLPVLDSAAIVEAIKSHRLLVRKSTTKESPILLRFHLTTREPLDIAPISKAMRELGRQSTLRAEVHFVADGNE